METPRFRINLNATKKIKKVVSNTEKSRLPALLSEPDFKKKVKPLHKQIDELTTLCSIPACLLIQSPLRGKGQCPRSYMWPESMDEVRDVFSLYELTKGKATKISVGGSEGSEVSKRVVLIDEGATDEWKKRVLSIDERSEKLTTNEWKKLLDCADEKMIDLKRRIETKKVGRVSSDFRQFSDNERLNKLSDNEVKNLLRELGEFDVKIESLEKEIEGVQRRKKRRKASLTEHRSRPFLDLNRSILQSTSTTLTGSNESVNS